MLPGSASSWLPCIDGLWERCPWQIEITVPKRIRDIFPTKTRSVRSPHRTRGSMAQQNGVVQSQQPQKSFASEFSQEELDLDMIVVCAGEFVKEVRPIHFVLLIADNYKELADENCYIRCASVGRSPSHCLCSWALFEDEFVRFKRI